MPSLPFIPNMNAAPGALQHPGAPMVVAVHAEALGQPYTQRVHPAQPYPGGETVIVHRLRHHP